MDQKTDEEMKEFIEEIADDLGYTRKNENKWRWNELLSYMPRGKSLVIGAASIFILLIIIILIFGNSNKTSSENLIEIQQRLESIENRLAFFEGIETKISNIETQGKNLNESVSKIERAEGLLEQRLDKLSIKLNQMKKDINAVREKTTAQLHSEKKDIPTGKPVYHVVRAGETLYRIAHQHGISVDDLCRLNNLNKSQTLSIGQKILISPGHSK